MKELIDKLPETYQPIEWPDGTVTLGNRDCEKRWEIFKDSINPHDTVLELGSATGFFSKRIAKEYPDSLVISVESDPIMCQIQREIYKEEGIYNIVVCQTRISAEDLIKWSQHADVFNKVLTMAVLHHFPAEKVEAVFHALAGFGEMINEIPPLEETNAYGQEAIKEIYKFLPEGQWLGSTMSHLGHERDIVLYESHGRENLDAFFGVSHPDRHRFTSEYGLLNDKYIVSGVNVWNLLHFNVVWPEPEWWVKQARCAYESITGFKSDVRPWNLLVTSSGLRAIDFSTHFPEGDQAEYREDDLGKLEKIFNQMKPLDWRDL